MKLFISAIFILCFIVFIGCDKKKKGSEPVPAIVIRKDTAQLKKEIAPARSPIINIVDSFIPKSTILYIKDSAATSERISFKLGAIFGSKFNKTIKDNKISIIGPPMVWYKSSNAPFYFEAGYPVNKKPLKPAKKILTKSIGGTHAVVAHFYGHYSSTYVGYEVLAEWLKERKKKRSGQPYEIYVTDPFDKNSLPADPYKVRTDIVFPYK
ncbi:MAG TPA: hypothetical protein PK504_01780 [Ferruginibacter sp.]|nr:hypothetical protein [Ferruginibacter sp.]HRE65179.1 hypothetical protein [Ferruginibacter sp.]